jgi:hypothetical protein
MAIGYRKRILLSLISRESVWFNANWSVSCSSLCTEGSRSDEREN